MFNGITSIIVALTASLTMLICLFLIPIYFSDPAEKAEMLKQVSSYVSSKAALEDAKLSGNNSYINSNGSTERDNSNNIPSGRPNNVNGSFSSGSNRDGAFYSPTQPYDYSGIESELDFEASVPDYWQNYDGVGPNPNGWAWQDKNNVPDLELNIDVPPFTDIGEGDTGERGGTWTLPEWNLSSELPFNPDNYNNPEYPGEQSELSMEIPDYTNNK